LFPLLFAEKLSRTSTVALNCSAPSPPKKGGGGKNMPLEILEKSYNGIISMTAFLFTIMARHPV